MPEMVDEQAFRQVKSDLQGEIEVEAPLSNTMGRLWLGEGERYIWDGFRSIHAVWWEW